MTGWTMPPPPIPYTEQTGPLHVMPTFKYGQRDDRLEELARQTLAKLVPTVHATWSLSQLNAMDPKQTRLLYLAAALDLALTERDASAATGADLKRQDTYMLNVLAAIVHRLKGGLPLPPNHAPRAIEQGDQVRIGDSMGAFTGLTGTVVEFHDSDTSLARVFIDNISKHTWLSINKLTVITAVDRETEMDAKQQALDAEDQAIAEERVNRNKTTATAETSTKYRRAQDIAAAAMRYRDAIQQLDLFQQDNADTNTPHAAARRRQLRNQVEQAQQILNEYSIAEQPAPTRPEPTSATHRFAIDLTDAAALYRDAVERFDRAQIRTNGEPKTMHVHRDAMATAAEGLNDLIESTGSMPLLSLDEHPAGEPTRAERDRMLTRMGFTAPFSDVTVVHMSSHVVGVRRRTVTNGRTLDIEETVRFTDPRPRRLP